MGRWPCPPHSWGGGACAGGAGPEGQGWAAAGRELALGSADQAPQRFLRATPQLSPQQSLHEPTPPPGRKVEVSIEPDERAALRRLSQRQVLVVVDSKWQVGDVVDPT